MQEQKLSAESAFLSLTQGRFPQSVLLSGAVGSGKSALALRLAQALLCTGDAPPCQSCNACHKVREGIHPDLTILDEGDGDIKVDQVRALRKDIHIRPNDGARRVVILHHAHRMNPMAQNALLKTLEEPPSFAFFLLTSAQAGSLLPTVLSRCTKYDLAPPEATEAEEALMLVLRPIVGALSMGDEVSLLKAAMALEKLSNPQQKSLLLLFRTAMRDALFASSGMGAPLLPALSGETAALARAVSLDPLLRVADFAATLLSRLEVNAASAATSSALCAGAFALCYA